MHRLDGLDHDINITQRPSNKKKQQLHNASSRCILYGEILSVLCPDQAYRS